MPGRSFGSFDSAHHGRPKMLLALRNQARWLAIETVDASLITTCQPGYSAAAGADVPRITRERRRCSSGVARGCVREVWRMIRASLAGCLLALAEHRQPPWTQRSYWRELACHGSCRFAARADADAAAFRVRLGYRHCTARSGPRLLARSPLMHPGRRADTLGGAFLTCGAITHDRARHQVDRRTPIPRCWC